MFRFQDKVTLEIRPELDFETIRGQLGVPTLVKRGIIGGFSLPVLAGDNEELFLSVHIPKRWDGASDIKVHVEGYLDTANNTKKFQLRVAWENLTCVTDIIPATSNNVNVETTTGNWVQYQGFEIEFIVDYDIDGAGAEIAVGDCLFLHLYRLAASGNEIAGEVVITHIGVVFEREILGDPV